MTRGIALLLAFCAAQFATQAGAQAPGKGARAGTKEAPSTPGPAPDLGQTAGPSGEQPDHTEEADSPAGDRAHGEPASAPDAASDEDSSGGREPEPGAAESEGESAEPAAPSETTAPPGSTAQVSGSESKILYYLERVEVRGNDKTGEGVIKHFVPLKPGDLLDVEDPAIESIRWRLMGTGWFNEVRLSLERGSTRGWVVLVVEVEERNTLVVTRVVAGLSRAVRKSTSSSEQVEPYAGLGIAETNLFGLGKGISVAGVYSVPQQGVDLRYSDPMFLGSRYSFNSGFFYNNARDFFGYENNIVDIVCPEPDPEDPEPCDPDVFARTAVVIYDRFGLSLGTGQDLTSTLRYTLDWQGELVKVENKPIAASTQRGEQREAIDFHINDGWSQVSSLDFVLIFDRRDDPALPSRGQLARFDTRVGTRLLGSDYNFTRFEGSYRFWYPLPWGHVLSPGVYMGIVFGQAPFFYRFYASDLSDLVPSRVLDLNLDHRGPPDLLGTSIAAMRAEDLAGRLDMEYRLPLHRGGEVIRGVDAYARVGLYALARLEDLRIAIPGYEGAALVPVDLTFDLGVTADTAIGLFQLGFSSLVRSLPDL
jgi:outer membrane protein insertion porin family